MPKRKRPQHLLIILTGLFAFNCVVKGQSNDKLINDSSNNSGEELSIDSNYSYHKFTNSVHFEQTNFNQEAEFSNASFYQNTHFTYTTFSNFVDFSNATFSGDAYFNDANFTQTDFLYSIRFKNYAYFDSATFEQEAILSNDIFFGNAYFLGTAFSQNADFTNAIFYKNADFENATFLKKVDFSNAMFHHKVFFNRLSLKDSGRFSFDEAILPDTLDFSHDYKIPNSIELTSANFKDTAFFDLIHNRIKKRHAIFLYKSDISKFHLDYIHFKILLTDPDVISTVSDDDIKGMYETLLNNFRSHGQEDSYEALDIEYQEYQWNTSPKWYAWFGRIDKLWWNFGYNKERVFIISLILISFFTFLNFPMLNFLNLNVYKMDNIPTVSWGSLRAIAGRLWYSFAYTSIIFLSFSLNTDKFKFNQKLGSIYLLIIYSIGIICLAYMANFVLQK